MVVHLLSSGRAHPKLVHQMVTIFELEREIQATFRWVYIPTDLNTQADLASRSNRVYSMPSVCITKKALNSIRLPTFTHILCSDAEGRLAQYRTSIPTTKFYSVLHNWFDSPRNLTGGTGLLEPPVDRARVLCEAVVSTITEQ